MDRPRFYRGLRIAWTVWWGIFCVLLVALWVRSYWWRERIVLGIYGNNAVQVGHVLGQVRLLTFSSPDISGFWQPDSSSYGRVKLPIDEWRKWEARAKDLPKSPTGFGGKIGSTGCLLYVPYWFLVIVSALSATFLWLPLTGRFSLRGS